LLSCVFNNVYYITWGLDGCYIGVYGEIRGVLVMINGSSLRNKWLLMGCIWIGLVIYLSFFNPPSEVKAIHFLDNFAHIFMYVFLTAWFGVVSEKKDMRFLFWCFFSMGLVIEVLQPLTGYRGFQFSDVIANLIGVYAGLCFCVLINVFNKKLFRT